MREIGLCRLKAGTMACIVGVLTGIVLLSGLTATAAATAPYSVYVGYADNVRANPSDFPTPWAGAPNSVYEGCPGSCAFDTGAAMIVNNTAATLKVDSVVLDFSSPGATTPCVYDIWPHGVSVPAHDQLIVTQNASGAANGCSPTSGLMDSSDIGPNGGGWAGSCNQSGIIPAVTVSVAGAATAFKDSGQVLNTGGIDGASCNPKTANESSQWTPIGHAACAGLSVATGPPTQTKAPPQLASVRATVANGCGNGLAGVPVAFSITAGPNTGTTATATSNASGQAAFTYASTKLGIDTIASSVTNTVGSVTAKPVTAIWETATLLLSTAHALPGDLVTFTGGGYAAGEQVALRWNATSGLLLGTVTASSTGTIGGSFAVPRPAAGVGPGYAVVALGATSAKQGWAPLSSGCTDAWINGAGGDFNGASNWSTGSVPGSSDVACIVMPGTYTVSMKQSNRVGGLMVGGDGTGVATLDVLAAQNGSISFDIGSGGTISSHGLVSLRSLDADAYTLFSGAGPLVNDGTFQTLQDNGGTRYVRVNLVNDKGGTVHISARDTRQDATTTTVNNGVFTVTSSSVLSLTANSSFVQSGGTLSNGGSLIENGASFTQSGGTASGSPVTLQSATLLDSVGAGSFLLQCSDTLSGTIPTAQTVTVQANGCGSAATTLSGTVTNNGTLTLDSRAPSQYSLVSGGTLTNNGTLSITPGGGIRYLRVNVANSASGHVTIAAADTRQDNGTTTTNNGSVAVTTTGGLSVTGGSSLVQSGGTLANSGSLLVSGAAFTQSGGTGSGHAVTLQSSTLTDSAGAGSFLLQCSNTLAGSVIPAGQSITIQGNGCGSASVSMPSSMTNNGTVTLDSTDASQYSLLSGGGTLTNNGMLKTIDDAGNIRYVRVNILNTSTGQLSIGASDTRQDNGTTTTNTGAFTVAATGSLALTGGSSFTQSAGTLANGGALSVIGGTFTQSAGADSGNPVVVQSSTLTDSAGAGSFVLWCGDNLAGTIPAGQTVTVQASGCGSATAVLAGTVTNNGTLVLDSLAADNYAMLSGGTLTNNGTFNVTQDAGGIRYLRSTLNNAASGTVLIGASDTRQDNGTVTTNAGKLDVLDGGGLALSGGASYTQPATAQLGVTIDAPAATGYGLSGGTISIAGTLNVTTVGSPATGASFPVITGSTLSGTFASISSGSVTYAPVYSASALALTKS